MTDCVNCGEPLPAGSRKDRRTCSTACRVGLFRARAVPDGPRGAPAAPGRSEALHAGPIVCPGCARSIGERTDGLLHLRGRWTGSDGVLWWSSYADLVDVRVPSPATIVCPGCRVEIAA